VREGLGLRRKRRSWGLIRQLPSGRFQAQWPDPQSGMSTPAPSTFRTRTEAGLWLDAKRTDLSRGASVDDKAAERPLRDWWPGFEVSIATLKPTTRTNYEAAWRLRVNPTFGHIPVGRIRPANVELWIAKLGEEGTSASKVIEAHGVLKRILDRPLRDRIISVNPALLRRKSLPRRPKTDRPVLSPEDIDKLTQAMRRDDDKALVRLLAYGGLRIGEALALRRRDFDPLRRTLAIRRSVEEVKGHLHVGETKPGDDRTITLPRAVAVDLEDRCEQIACEPDALIFGNRQGRHRRYRVFMRDSWLPAAEEAGISVTPHDLRATCASLLIDAGASVKDVQALLGHKDEMTTLALYARVRPGKSENLAKKMDQLLDEAGSPLKKRKKKHRAQ